VNPQRCDFAILTVQDAELRAVLDIVEIVAEDTSLPEPLYRIRMPDSQVVGVVMPTGGVGRVEAAIATNILLTRAMPSALFLIGIAGGFPANGVALGDVIVAEQVVDYEMQRIADDKMELRPRIFEADHRLIGAALEISKGAEWRQWFRRHNEGEPRLHFGPVLSGDKVIASEAFVAGFLDRYPELIGVEMEGAGVAAALARWQAKIPFLMIRGVVDFANPQKRADSSFWLADACAATAAFALASAIRLESYPWQVGR
jgi:nucleoside phosphorylase